METRARNAGCRGRRPPGEWPGAPLRPPDTDPRDSDTRGRHRWRPHVHERSDRESRVDSRVTSRTRHANLSKHERRNLAVARIKITICQQKTQDTIVRHHTHAKTKHSASSHPSLRERLNYLCRPRCSVDVVVGGGEHPLFMLLTSLLHRGGRLAQVRAAPRPRRSSSGDDDGELLG